MSQFLDHKPDGTFMIYYPRPWLSGTPDFEHKVYVHISAVRNAKHMDGTDDEDTLIVECPCGCGHVATVPLVGGEEAQRLHAKYHAHKSGKPYVETAIADVMERVKAKGGEPKLNPKIG